MRRAFCIVIATAAVIALAACSTGLSLGPKSVANRPPNVDFYLMLDTSPSMEIAATSGGAALLEAATQSNENGCALGCHQSETRGLGVFHNPSGGPIACTASGVYADGTAFSTSSTFPVIGRDNYDLSRCLGVGLRIDMLKTAVQDLTTNAASMEASSKSAYRIALYETDANRTNPAKDLSLYRLQRLTSKLASARAAGASIAALEMYQNNVLAPGVFNSDMDTYLDADIASMNRLMPSPGNGAHNLGDRPQEVLFIVTDGLNDETPRRTYAPMDWNGVNCEAVKKRGVRIAVLYTTYEPLDDPWYRSQIAPALPKGLPPDLPSSTPVGSDPMALAALQCASPGLYSQVSADGDVPAATQALFRRAVQTASLTR